MAWFPSSPSFLTPPIILGGCTVVPTSVFRDLGFYLDSHLSFSAHISSVTRTCFYHLRQLRRSLSHDTHAVLVQAFVSTRLDYCNSCLVGAPAYLLSRLQSVLNASARLIANLPRRSHVTPILKDLHWLLVPQRIEFKVCLLVYKCLHRLAPPYLSRYCIPTSSLSGRSHLRSASRSYIFVPDFSTKPFGLRGFMVSGPRCCYFLPSHLRLPSLSLPRFCSLPKAHLFSCTFPVL